MLNDEYFVLLSSEYEFEFIVVPYSYLLPWTMDIFTLILLLLNVNYWSDIY